ncbi:FAD-binding oxidoreductase [Candidatus Saccharibacteria bacterium]|nr:FAD-binding oxidoreductase [Candidatus Saccharibacteria bacterium]
MSKISDYLRQHLTGEVSTEPNVRRALARDGSVFELAPQLAIYPRTTNDVRKVMRFAWRLAERGQVLPITARGGGTSTTGAVISSGAILSFTSHMASILELDVRSNMVRVQPGVSITSLNEAMATHGLFFPVEPSNARVATVGGALASNASGVKATKYGSIRNWTDRLEVVLANGEIIQTERLTKQQLSRKKGLQTMEGEIYRSLDALIDDYSEKLSGLDSNAPFPLHQVKAKDGSFNLMPLIVGSEGTLGIITQAILKLESRPDDVSLIAAAIPNGIDVAGLTDQLKELEPSQLDFIDGETLKLIEAKDGGTPWQVVSKTRPATLIFIEFDDKHRAKKVKKVAKILTEAGVADAEIADTFEDQEALRAVNHSVSVITNFADQHAAALPISGGLMVTPNQVPELVDRIKKVLTKNHVAAGIWGSLGAGRVDVWPLLNLANLGQRQALFKLTREIRTLVEEMGGSILIETGGGRMGAAFTEDFYGAEIAATFVKVKKIFDPFSTLNSGVKTGTTQAELVKILRKNYDRARFAELNLS